MKTWMLPWLFPVGMLATVVLLTVFRESVGLVAVIAGWLLVPVLWRTRFSPSDDETHYWRIKRP
jgi:hypothetical protein